MIKTSGVHHITAVGSNREDTVRFYEGVLGMPLVFEQPNLDEPDVLHLFFDTGDGRLLTFFVHDKQATDATPPPLTVGSVHHLAFTVDRETYERALQGLRERHIPNSGRVDRGFMWSLYFRDPNGMLLELSSYKFTPPAGFSTADVLREAHRLRVAAGAAAIGDEHLEQAVANLEEKHSPVPAKD